MKKWIRNFLVAALITVYITPIHAAIPLGKGDTEKYLDRVENYITTKITNPTYGSVGGEWAVMGLARYGKISRDYIGIYKSNIRKKIEECNGNLSDKKYTEYARVTIALTSIGENPRDFYGYNLVKPLAELEHVKSQGANGIVYTLIALDCNTYTIPSPDSKYDGEVTTREKLISLILNAELSDGGWAYSGKVANADMTAMTIQALTPYYNKRKDVKKAVDRGLNALSDLQLSDGSFASGKIKTCESTAQVIAALSEMRVNIADKRFVKNGHTVMDGLFQYYENGGFRHLPDGGVNQMATEQSMYALTAYYRSITGKNRLYQMSDEKETIANKGNTKKQQNNKKETSGKSNKKTDKGVKAEKKSLNNKNKTNNRTADDGLNTDYDAINNENFDTNRNNPDQNNGQKNFQDRTKVNRNNQTEESAQAETVIRINDNGETIVVLKNQKEEAENNENRAKNNINTKTEKRIVIMLIILFAAGGGIGFIILRKRKKHL